MRHLTLVLALVSPLALAELSDVEKMVEASRAARASQVEPPSRNLPPLEAVAPLYQPTPSRFDTTPIRSAPSLPPASYEALDLPPTSRAWQPDNSHLEVRPTVTCYKGASGSVVCH